MRCSMLSREKKQAVNPEGEGLAGFEAAVLFAVEFPHLGADLCYSRLPRCMQ